MINDVSNLKSISTSPIDLAIDLGPSGIKTIQGLIIRAYNNLQESGKIDSSMSETEISEELFIELQIEWKDADISLIPVHEKSHGRRKKGPGKTPTIDFCFRHRWDSQSYFGAECKLLKNNDNTLYTNYVEKGIKRYLSGSYSPKCSIGSMIGYITVGSPSDVINEIKKRVDRISDVECMNLSYSLNGFKMHYKSMHKRQKGPSPFHMMHMFFPFT